VDLNAAIGNDGGVGNIKWWSGNEANGEEKIRQMIGVRVMV
jgi:hypothetical protein